MDKISDFSMVNPILSWNVFSLTKEIYCKQLPLHLFKIAESVPENTLEKRVVHLILALFYAIPILNIITYVALRNIAPYNLLLSENDSSGTAPYKLSVSITSFKVLSKKDLEELDTWVDCAPHENRTKAREQIVLCDLKCDPTLDLSGLQLTSLPNCIAKLTYLKTLNLCDNQFVSIPESILPLSQLENLDISRNKISSLSGSLPIQAKLLNLSNNTISSLPENLSHLNQLTTLCLHDNSVVFSPDLFTELSSLEYLFLEDWETNSLEKQSVLNLP